VFINTLRVSFSFVFFLISGFEAAIYANKDVYNNFLMRSSQDPWPTSKGMHGRGEGLLLRGRKGGERGRKGREGNPPKVSRINVWTRLFYKIG